jgi:hypothetical protein
MNFFFHTCNAFVKSKLTIPKFQNSGKTQTDLNLYQADIVKSNWIVGLVACKEDDFFWIIDSTEENKNSIYFIANEEQSKKISIHNLLLDLNNFTDTTPDYRANLEISNIAGATSSYQSELPFRMTEKIGAIYSDCGVLTSNNAVRVGVFLRNIYCQPIKNVSQLYLYDNKTEKLLNTFQVSLNETCYIDLTQYKEFLLNSFIYSKDYLGIPIYLIDYGVGGLSFEHTHPPHESIQGESRFHLVNKLKVKTNEKIVKANFS